MADKDKTPDDGERFSIDEILNEYCSDGEPPKLADDPEPKPEEKPAAAAEAPDPQKPPEKIKRAAPKPPRPRTQEENDSPTIELGPAIAPAPPPPPEEKSDGPTPRKAAQKYISMLHGLRVRSFVMTIVCVLMAYIVFALKFELPLPSAVRDDVRAQLIALLALQLVSGFVAADVFLRGVRCVRHLRLQIETLADIAWLSSLAHTIISLVSGPGEFGLPMSACASAGFLFILLGTRSKFRAYSVALRAAAGVEKPYTVVRDNDQWEGPAFIKIPGDGRDFVRQLESGDAASRASERVTPFLVIFAIALSVLLCAMKHDYTALFRHLSAISAAGVSFSAGLAFNLPFRKLSKKLAGRSAALAGWGGAKLMTGSGALIVGDNDLYPPGTVALTGMKIFGGFSAEKVLSFAGSVIVASGSGLSDKFLELMKGQGAPLSAVNRLEWFPNGVSAYVSDCRVLVGTKEFLADSGVYFQQAQDINDAVYAAVNYTLAGIFAVGYTSNNASGDALDLILSDDRLAAVMAVRNFHFTQEFIATRMKLSPDEIEYPELMDRVQLSDQEDINVSPAAAVICREGLLPFAETVVGGRRLKKAVTINIVLSIIGAVLGMLIVFYLGMLGEYSAGGPANLLLYSLFWLLPTLLVSGWINRY